MDSKVSPPTLTEELKSQIGEKDGLKEKLLRMCRQNKLAAFSAGLIVIVLLIGALSFFPALALGPIAEFVG